MLAGGLSVDPEEGMYAYDEGDFELDEGNPPAGWSVPLRSLDIEYYDGSEEEWVEEWDSTVLERLPWSVRVKINFPLTEEGLEAEEDAGIDPDEDPDLLLVVPIPLATGAMEAPANLQDPIFAAPRQGGGSISASGQVQPDGEDRPDDDEEDDER